MAAGDEGQLVCGQSVFLGRSLRCRSRLFTLHKAAMQRTPASRKGSAENRGNCCQRKHPAEVLALGPSCASHRRSSNASAAGIRLDHRKSVRPFKGIILDHISEFEYSHAVGLSASPFGGWRVSPCQPAKPDRLSKAKSPTTCQSSRP